MVHKNASTDALDERIVGLDHFALMVRDRPTLGGG
jgi:hypothetical protein